VDRPDEDLSAWTQVCPLQRLIDQGIVCASLKGAELILIWSDGRAVACERACPHEQADLSHGHLSAGRLVCPHHAASFDLEDGSISEGWASRRLRIYPVRVEQCQVWVKVAET
jgi:nitrite reductase/ring-hydroxylating ferredoxin subunit